MLARSISAVHACSVCGGCVHAYLESHKQRSNREPDQTKFVDPTAAGVATILLNENANEEVFKLMSRV